MRHRDLVVNDWDSEYQERVGWITEVAERMIHPWLIDRSGIGSMYQFATDPHDDADCPFKNSEQLPTTRKTWTGLPPLRDWDLLGDDTP